MSCALILLAALPAQLPQVGIHESRASDRQVRQIQADYTLVALTCD